MPNVIAKLLVPIAEIATLPAAITRQPKLMQRQQQCQLRGIKCMSTTTSLIILREKIRAFKYGFLCKNNKKLNSSNKKNKIIELNNFI